LVEGEGFEPSKADKFCVINKRGREYVKRKIRKNQTPCQCRYNRPR
jgi:hypothetical protein